MKIKVPAVTLESIMDDKINFWHYFFGVAGCNIEINVFNSLDISTNISKGEYPRPI